MQTANARDLLLITLFKTLIHGRISTINFYLTIQFQVALASEHTLPCSLDSIYSLNTKQNDTHIAQFYIAFA